jgi:type IV secretory pathway VirJ component
MTFRRMKLPPFLFIFISLIYILFIDSPSVVRSEEALQYGRFGTVTIYGGTKNPVHVVLFVSGDDGWNKGVVDMAKALASKRTMVIGIDIVQYIKHVAESMEANSYPAGDFEMLSQYVQRKLGLPVYHHPVLMGYSSGAALVYVVLAETPETFPGAVSIGFCPNLLFPKPLNKGYSLEYKIGPKNKGFIFLPAKNLSTPWIALQGDVDKVCDPLATEAFVKQVGSGTILMLRKVGHGFSEPKNWMPQFKEAFQIIIKHEAAVDVVSKSTASDAKSGISSTESVRLDDLPIVELPVKESVGDLMAVIISGDGGWAGIDSDMGRLLSAKGIPVVGLDSLKYFWKQRTPDGAALDLGRILRHYGDAWGKKNALLIGYSRGADVMPFMVNRLPKDLRDRIKLQALLGLSEKVSFEFHLSDWIIGTSHPMDLPIQPEIEKLRGMKMLCFCGKSEDDSLCRKLDTGLVKTITMKGGHHFGGDYKVIIDHVLSMLK